MKRRRSRGFTLIELTVSLVAGLIVAMAVATLSHEATASFHEEVRISAAEASIRSAVDRLRSDLQRASFMSTANVQMEPLIGKAYDQPNVANAVAAATPGLAQIQGIRFYAGSGAINTANGLPLDTTNSVTPAKVDITGNMTTADQFEVQSAVMLGTGCCQINLAGSSPAIFRVLNANATGTIDSNADPEMKAMFQPVTGTGSQFVVRYVDAETNHSQFLLTCSGTQAAGINVGPPVQPYVLTATCPLTGAQTKTVTGSNGNNGGLAWVNPVQTVRWEIIGPTTTADTVPAQEVNGLDNQAMVAGRDANKYDLVRSLLDGATGAVIPETTEVIAEYAIDLDLAFAVDVSADVTGATPLIRTYDFGDPANQMVGNLVADLKLTGATSGLPTNANPEPQRIRSVRLRLATRAGLADRQANISAPSMGDAGTGTFLLRYCLTAAGCSGTTTLQWARVRTLVTEVSLPNQQQAFY